MSEYLLTLRLPLSGAADDPAARAAARALIEALPEELAGAEVKLQQVFADRPPRPVAGVGSGR